MLPISIGYLMLLLKNKFFFFDKTEKGARWKLRYEYLWLKKVKIVTKFRKRIPLIEFEFLETSKNKKRDSSQIWPENLFIFALKNGFGLTLSRDDTPSGNLQSSG